MAATKKKIIFHWDQREKESLAQKEIAWTKELITALETEQLPKGDYHTFFD